MTYYHFSKVYYEGEDKLFSQTVTLANGSIDEVEEFTCLYMGNIIG